MIQQELAGEAPLFMGRINTVTVVNCIDHRDEYGVNQTISPSTDKCLKMRFVMI